MPETHAASERNDLLACTAASDPRPSRRLRWWIPRTAASRLRVTDAATRYERLALRASDISVSDISAAATSVLDLDHRGRELVEHGLEEDQLPHP